MKAQAFRLAGVSPNEIACSACTFGVETHFIHRYAQFGCFALAESIHVSSQPVAPSFGMISFTGTFAASRLPVVTGQDAPSHVSPFLNRLTSSDDKPQYFLIRGFCFLIRAIAASN